MELFNVIKLSKMKTLNIRSYNYICNQQFRINSLVKEIVTLIYPEFYLI